MPPAGAFLKRFPPKAYVLPVYAVTAFLIYGWTLGVSLWKMPSWLYSLTVTEILAVNSYAFTLDLIESLLVTGGLLGLSFVLPAKLLRDHFAARGSVLAACIVISVMLHLGIYANGDLRGAFIKSLPLWWIGTLLIAAILLAIVSRFRRAAVAIESFADRLIIFLYLFVPLSVAAIVNLLLRNVS